MGGLGLALECHGQFSLMEKAKSEMPHRTGVSLNVIFLRALSRVWFAALAVCWKIKTSTAGFWVLIRKSLEYVDKQCFANLKACFEFVNSVEMTLNVPTVF